MTLLEKLNNVKEVLKQLNEWLEYLCRCNHADIVFGTQLGTITQQLRDLSRDYIESANNFEVDRKISIPIYDNIQAAIQTIKDANEDENRLTYYCFCIGKAHNYISAAIFGLYDWTVSIELS